MKNLSANELRIGNFIQKGSSLWKVTIGDLYNIESEHKPNKYKPIHLTDEWFILCQSNSIFNNGFSYRKTNTGRYDIFCDSVFITVIEFVHELQNLNFALLGEELIFNKEYL